MQPSRHPVCLAALAGSPPATPTCQRKLGELGVNVVVFDDAIQLLGSLAPERTVICALHMRNDGEQAWALLPQLGARPGVGVLALGCANDLDRQIRSLLLGADVWLSEQAPPALIATTAYALFRRVRTNAVHAAPTLTGHAVALAQGWRLEEDGWILVAPNGRRVSLTQRERDLLILLAQQAGSVVSRQALAHGLGALGGSLSPRSVSMMVSRLRHKARGAGEELPLATGRAGRGYRLEAPLPGLPQAGP